MPTTTSFTSAVKNDNIADLPPLPVDDVAARDEEVIGAAYQSLLSRIGYLSESDLTRVHEAYMFARAAHEGQRRNSGEPYITHPIAVTEVCSCWQLDAPALMAALMHDAMEDCGINKDDIRERFGSDVAELVDGLTKLEKLQFLTREENQAESFRKMLLAMAKDVRVILIKLADRTHNMRTLGGSPRSKWSRISRETLEIYVPIADRLGLNSTYRELQELAFQHLHPWRHQVLSKAVAKVRKRREELVRKIHGQICQAFDTAKISVRVEDRGLRLYKVYQQMTQNQMSFARVNDILGFRIIFEKVVDCYTGIGVLHQLYRPAPGTFKDYIASAKSNGYQSLHTSLLGPSGVDVEVELRTEVMDMVAESGIAAHWLYRGKHVDGLLSDGLSGRWLKSLLEIENETKDAAEFLDNVKVDLFPDSIYVFTPKNHILTLPIGATVVDFAYAIHSNVGNHVASALVNGEPASLRAVLKNNDVIEIITSEDVRPNHSWLDFVKTGRARSKIRSFLKQEGAVQSAQLGERLLEQALKAAGYGDVPFTEAVSEQVWNQLGTQTQYRDKTRQQIISEIGMGKLLARVVVDQMAPELQKLGIKPNALLLSRGRLAGDAEAASAMTVLAVGGADSAPARFAVCCRPVPGDAIAGVLLRGRGLEVHRDNCLVAERRFAKDPGTHVSVEWAEDAVAEFDASLTLILRNTKGALADASSMMAQLGVNILRINMVEDSGRDTVEVKCLVGVRDTAHIDSLLKSLHKLRAVLRAQRGMEVDA